MARSVPVIAVFGSDVAGTPAVSRKLGEAIALSGATLLTGGGQEPTENSVKEQAMEGARSAPRRRRGARIGVLGKEENEVWEKAVADEFLMSLAFSHRRNYVNAMLCDVAVAFVGGNGTTSEVAFALAAERPILLLGAEWAQGFPLVRTEAAFQEFLRSSKARVPDGDGEDPVDFLIKRAYKQLTLKSGAVVEHLPLAHPPEEVTAQAAKMARDDHLRGHFPDLPDRTGIAMAFQVWLAARENG